MKRPLCLLSVIITAIVYLYLEFFLSDHIIDYSNEDGSQIQIVGIVDRKEIKVDYLGELSPVIYIIPLENKESLGKNKYIQCYMSKEDYIEPKIGEYVRVSGTVKSFSSGRNPGEFDSRLYYSTLKIAYRIKNAHIKARAGNCNAFYEALYRARYKFENVLDRNLNSQDASIMKAILLGDKSFMDDDIKKIYKDAGIIHILAVSGLHISIIGMGLYKLLKKLRLPPLFRTLIPIVIMYCYGQMCGMSSSSARAIVMFSINLLARIIGRSYDLLTSLALVELLLLVEQPLYLYNSGFLFSFGAIIGIGYVLPAVMKLLPEHVGFNMRFADDPQESLLGKLLNYIKQGILAGLSIMIATFPVYMSFTYVYPIQSLFLNLLVLPLMAPLMVLGLFVIIVGTVLPVKLVLSSAIIHVILAWYASLGEAFRKIPVGRLYLGHTEKWKIVIYCIGVILFVTVIGTSRQLRGKMIGCLALVVSFILLVYFPKPDLSVTMLDVGQGDGIIIRTRHENYLIDGGSTDKKEVGKYTIIPYLYYEGIGCLDAVIITHEDEDHISGVFEIMDDMEDGGIKIKNLILPDISDKSKGENYRKIVARAKELSIPVKYISCGERIRSDVEIRCLNPIKGMATDEANSYSTAIYIKYRNFTALFTGDISGEGEEHLYRDIVKDAELSKGVNVLKVAHHGSKYSTGSEILEALRPDIALISCGINNKYGHPHKELMDRLDAGNVRVYRTDNSGAISIIIKGKRMMVSEFVM